MVVSMWSAAEFLSNRCGPSM